MKEATGSARTSIALFLATLFTTTATGSMAVHADQSVFPLVDGLSFSLPLMAILLAHELGHFFAAKHHGVPASLPMFIPLPPGLGFLGTLGAVIFQSGTTDRKKLIDIGAAGPLAGLVVALPVLVYGLMLSKVGPIVGISGLEGDSLLYAGLKRVLTGRWLPGGGDDVFLHPVARAGWGGLLVTMLNLLPIGQLDGGHVATAYFGNRYERVASLLHRSLPVLALAVFWFVGRVVQREASGQDLPDEISVPWIAALAAAGWMVWFVLLLAMYRVGGRRHHPPVDDSRPLPRSRAALFWVVAVVYALIFMPVPFRFAIGKPPPERPAATGAP